MATPPVSAITRLRHRAHAAVLTVANALCILKEEYSRAAHAAALAQRPRHGLRKVSALYVTQDSAHGPEDAEPAQI